MIVVKLKEWGQANEENIGWAEAEHGRPSYQATEIRKRHDAEDPCRETRNIGGLCMPRLYLAYRGTEAHYNRH